MKRYAYRQEADALRQKDIIYLWEGSRAPYSDESPEQAQPSLTAYPVSESHGAVIVCPGGGYVKKAPHEGAPVAEKINEAGISAFVLDYRVAPCNYNAPLADAQRAIRLLRYIGYEKVGILGFSAGGHLACSAATLYDAGDDASTDPVERLSSRPDALVSCYSVVSFTSFRHQGSLENLLGAEHKNDLSLLRRFSAELHVTEDTPPCFLWHTAEDGGVPVENSLNLAAALAHAGVPFEMHIYPHGRHGLGLAPDHEDVRTWSEHMNTWLKGLGFGI